MDNMIYKGYEGDIKYDYEKRKWLYRGRVLNIDDIISYEGETEDECIRDFKRAVDFYEEMKNETTGN
jgi:predicted HicB family RNase H-like nuclease